MSCSRAPRRGFALIVTILLVAFLVLILVGLASFTRVETQVADNTQNLAKARQNALFAMNLALGELQRTAGPDQRATFTADIGTGDDGSLTTDEDGDSTTPDNGLPFASDGAVAWVGVAGNTANPVNSTDPRRAGHLAEQVSVLNWLVSGNEGTAFSANTTASSFGKIDSTGTIKYSPASVITGLSATSKPTDTNIKITPPGGTEAGGVLVVGPGSAANSVIPAEPHLNYVVAPLVDIVLPSAAVPGFEGAAGNTTIGRYAWWVGDEGVKARVDLTDPNEGVTTGDNAVRRTQVASRAGVERVSGMSGWVSGTTPAAKLLTPEQLAFVPTVSSTTVKARFHDLTTYSLGVLADTAKGGLKKDLTAGLFGDSPTNGELADSAAIFNLPSPTASTAVTTAANLRDAVWSGETPAATALPNWGLLRSHVRFGRSGVAGSLSGELPSIAPRLGTDSAPPIAPVVTRAQLYFHGAVDGSSVSAMYFPSIVLWNPYDVRLEPQVYSVRISLNTNSSNPTSDALRFSAGDAAGSVKTPVYLATYGPDFGPLPLPATGTEDLNTVTYRQKMEAVRGASNIITSHKGFAFVIDCNVPIEPGQAIVFTPANNEALATSPANRVLKPGWNYKYFYENLTGISPPAGKTVVRYLHWNGVDMQTAHDVELGLGASFDAINHKPTSLLRQVANIGVPGGIEGGTGIRTNLRLDPALPSSGWGNAIAGVQPGLDKTVSELADVSNLGGGGAVPAGAGRAVADGTVADFDPGSISAGGLAYRMHFSRDFKNYGSSESSYARTMFRWVGSYNPLALAWRSALPDVAIDRTLRPLRVPYFLFNDNGGQAPINRYIVELPDPTGNETYVGSSHYNAGSTVGEAMQRLVLIHLPRTELGTHSIAALQHAYIHPNTGQIAAGNGYNAMAMPTYVIGNSLPDARVHPADTDGFPNNWNDNSFTPAGGNFNISSAAGRRFHFDASFVLNRALWDRYFFSGVPLTGNLLDASGNFQTLPNSRFALYDPKKEVLGGTFTAIRDYHQAAAKLMVRGGFNVNSTSVEAWTAHLASTRNAPVRKADGAAAALGTNTSPWPRQPRPLANALGQADPLDSNGNEGPENAHMFRALTDAQVTLLAEQIVAEIRRRGPVLSLAQFINRKPSAGTVASYFDDPEDPSTEAEQALLWQRLLGPLQAAIDRIRLASATGFSGLTVTGINDGAAGIFASGPSSVNESQSALVKLGPPNGNSNPDSNAAAVGRNVFHFRQAAAGSRDYASLPASTTLDDIIPKAPLALRSAVAGMPGYLTQADLLQAIGPSLSARSDTFRIRSYGEVINPATGATDARAWLEVIVQRLPDFVDSSDTADEWRDTATPTSLTISAINQQFGRRFQVVAFRWLSPDDV